MSCDRPVLDRCCWKRAIPVKGRRCGSHLVLEVVLDIFRGQQAQLSPHQYASRFLHEGRDGIAYNRRWWSLLSEDDQDAEDAGVKLRSGVVLEIVVNNKPNRVLTTL